MNKVIFPRVSYEGINGAIITLADKYCDSMGAYQVATIRTDSGDTVNIGNKYDQSHAFPRPYALAPVLLKKWAAKRNAISSDTRKGRFARMSIESRIERLSKAYYYA